MIYMPYIFAILQEENIQRCSMSTESHIGNSGPDDSSDDDNNSKNEYHNAENEVEPVTDDDDNERALSGKMSESSGGTSSDLYEYKVISSASSFNILTLTCQVYMKHLFVWCW